MVADLGCSVAWRPVVVHLDRGFRVGFKFGHESLQRSNVNLIEGRSPVEHACV